MSILSRITDSKAYGFPAVIPVNSVPSRINYSSPELRQLGNDITLYPQDNGERYLQYGYNLNDAVYSIVSKNAEKASQVRFWVAKIKSTERKTLQEYNLLQKEAVTTKTLHELNKMRKSMTDERVITGPLAKLLSKPNRNQTQSEWLEAIFAFRELQGEGNLWLSKGDGDRTLEMFIIPKPNLNLIGNSRDVWDLVSFQININGTLIPVSKQDMIMWKYNNPHVLDNSFEHLRGLAPLSAAIILLQSMNEGDLRVATSNKNGGANGFAFRKDATGEPSLEQKQEMRRQFNDVVNSSAMVNKVAMVSGDWGYYNLGFSVEDQKLLEQYGYGFKRMCRVFKTPAGIFDEGNQTWDNQKQFFRQWIYSKIAPNLYNLRGMLTDKLIPEFGLDPETHLIDCDVSSLPELAEDIKDRVAAVKDADWLTPDEKRIETGYEPIGSPEMQQLYVSSALQTLQQINEPTGGDLSNELNLLGNG